MALSDKHHLELMQLLSEIKPDYVPASNTIRQWWETTALPYLRDSALSQLRRTNQFKPALIGFMENGAPGVIDLDKATGGFGDQRSKDAVAFLHKVSALLPGTQAVVFCCETWALKARNQADQDLINSRGSIHDHPDREEAVMFNMLHYNHANNTMMQLMTICFQVKVLGANTSPRAWRDTTFGEETTSDPKDPNARIAYTGRFVPSDPANEATLVVDPNAKDQ